MNDYGLRLSKVPTIQELIDKRVEEFYESEKEEALRGTSEEKAWSGKHCRWCRT